MDRSPIRSVAELAFTPEQREWLGLGERDSLRLLSTGGQLLLLERTGPGAEGMALPWDRDLVAVADVRAFPLAEILQLLHTAAKSGFLFFENGDHAKSVYLHQGEVVFAASNQTGDRLGETLLRAGVIRSDQFDAARRAYTRSCRFGRILVERGYLTPRELWNGVKLQVEEIVRSLFSYAAGRVYFWEGEVRPDNVVRLSLATRPLIAQGLRRRDELLRFLAWLEDPRVRLTRSRAGARELGETERALFGAIDGHTGFSEACRRAGLDPLTGARTLQLLRLFGCVEVTREADATPSAPEDPRAGDDEAIRACVARYAKILAELAAPVVAVEGPEPIRERLQGVLKEAARRYPELLSGVRVGSGGALDPEALADRALRYPGEREREVRLALGELVSYLEFELLNHPKISEPETFLEAVEGLRSEL